MNKIIFELCEVKETPKSEPKLTVQINMEPFNFKKNIDFYKDIKFY